MHWLWFALPGVFLLFSAYLLWWHIHIFRTYLPFVGRIFQEQPLFIVPFGKPIPDAEEIKFPTTDNLTLQGCYIRARGERKGVILFGLEFRTNRWSCQSYCDFLREAGYDVFSFEMRGQGDSPSHEGYEPLQWVTEFEVRDFESALAYLKGRGDADPNGVGFFGLSKGAGAGMIAASADPYVRCLVTDGMFGTYSTMLPYMRKWIVIYSKNPRLAAMLPTWYYHHAANVALRGICAERGCRFPRLSKALPRVAPRPILMIHGGADNYIKPEMAKKLFETAGAPKDLWIVEGAKHNQAINQAAGEYQRRVLGFFEKHLTHGNGAESGNGVLVSRESSNKA
ncbi:MAG: alpha/beta fold hydrolase [Planctomycetes bacterium]|nr:alpha/beta fold hydrolase [Planctomycetota bacterium]